MSKKDGRGRNDQIFSDDHPFREMITPFADALVNHANLRKRARIQLSAGLADAFDSWLAGIVLYRSPAIHKTFEELLQRTTPLVDLLKKIDSAYQSGSHSLFDNDPHGAIGFWLNDVLKSATPSVDIGLVLTGLTAIAQLAEYDLTERADPYPERGRPVLDEYPCLALLIFRLELEWLWSVGSALSVYKKRSGELQVSAGSLIQVLDALRKHIAGFGWKWLADYLPPSDGHLRHVPTYQRILTRARKLQRSYPRAHARALTEGMKPFLRRPP
jgi:hypothetical protein